MSLFADIHAIRIAAESQAKAAERSAVANEAAAADLKKIADELLKPEVVGLAVDVHPPTPRT